MKHFILSWFFLFTGLSLKAQPELLKTTLSPVEGGTHTTANISVIDAGGEVFHAESDALNIHLSEGFIGPDLAHLLGIENYQALEGVSLYPNPVKNRLTVGLPGGKSYEIHIHSLSGKEIMQMHTESSLVRIDARPFPPGVYLVTIIDRENRQFVTCKIQKI